MGAEMAGAEVPGSPQLVSLASEVQDLHLAQRKELALGFRPAPTLGMIPDIPSLLDTLSYSYCYVGIMTGECCPPGMSVPSAQCQTPPACTPAFFPLCSMSGPCCACPSAHCGGSGTHLPGTMRTLLPPAQPRWGPQSPPQATHTVTQSMPWGACATEPVSLPGRSLLLHLSGHFSVPRGSRASAAVAQCGVPGWGLLCRPSAKVPSGPHDCPLLSGCTPCYQGSP